MPEAISGPSLSVQRELLNIEKLALRGRVVMLLRT